jgi:glycosyltransferase involved in cell wall biosynthesis
VADAASAPDLSLVITTFRETSVLAGSLPRITEALRGLRRPVEIVFVDDGSGDETPAWVEAQFLSLADLSPRLLRHDVNRGRGAALRTGFGGSRGRFCGYLDLDLEVDVAYLADALRLLDAGADVVVGVRTYEKTRPGFDVRTFLSVGYKHLSRTILRHRLHDTETGFKFFRRDALARVLPQIREAGWFFDTEVMMVTWLAGLRIAELPVVFRRRHDKVSTVKIARDVRRYLGSLARFVARRPRLVRELRALRPSS